MLRSAGPSVLAPAAPFLKVLHRVWGRQVSGPGAGVWGGMSLTLAALPVEDSEPLIPREELRADPDLTGHPLPPEPTTQGPHLHTGNAGHAQGRGAALCLI